MKTAKGEIFVLCLFAATEHGAADPLNLDQWAFWIVPGVEITTDTLSLGTVESRYRRLKFTELAAEFATVEHRLMSAHAASDCKTGLISLVAAIACVAFASCLLPSAIAVAQASSCALPSGDDGKKPTSNISRTDTQIAAALKQALADPTSSDSDTRSEIIMQGVFGPCFMTTTRDVQFEIGWLRRPIETYDRAKDTQLAVDGMVRIARLFRTHKIALEGRVANIIIQRQTQTGTRYLTVHWPIGVMRNALSSSKDSDNILRAGYLVHDGEAPPQEWVARHLLLR